MEIWNENKIVFDGKVVRLRVGSVLLDNNDTAYREVVEHPGGACILPFTGDAFILVRQYRIALQEYILEAPAGKLEPDESPGQCAAKELHEETGHQAATIVPLGVIYPSVGFCNERIHLFLAMGLNEIGKKPEPEERIETIRMPVAEAREALSNNAFKDGKTHIILHRALNFLEKQHGLL